MNRPPAPPPPPPGQVTGAPARILERGYRRYEGTRLGPFASVRAVWTHSLQRMLGLRRSVWAKLLPAGVIFIAYVPAIVFVGIVALAGDDPMVTENMPRYADYYQNVVLAVILFAAFSAPDVLCPDRRTGMLGLYLASPLSRTTYLLAKAAAVFTGLITVTVGPQLLLLIANTLQTETSAGALLMAVRIVAAGFVVAILFTVVTMAISSFTDRRGFAGAAIILIFLASGVVGAAISDSHPALALVGLASALPEALTTRTFGVVSSGPTADVATATVWLTGLGVVAVGSAVTWFRYRTISVTR